MSNYYCFFPVRDGAKHIGEVMESLVTQSIVPTKIIVVDDGSTDSTSKILKEYKEQFPELIEIIRTENKTRDYKRLPELWNMSLRDGYDYHMICAGDVSFEKDYAKKILERMDADEDIVVASGGYKPFNASAPHGAGRFVRQSFFDKVYDDGKYKLIIGYETETLTRARMLGKKIRIYNDIVFNHLDKLGHGHNFGEFGCSMKALGYHPLWAIGRCIVDIKKIGIKGAFGVFTSYVNYRPNKDGYYSQFDDDVRKFTRDNQIGKIKKIIHIY
jgi:glycosyltransferase involved in cell wall biosynthesis